MSEFQVSVRSPVVIDSQPFFSGNGPGPFTRVEFNLVPTVGLPAPDGLWELDFFYPSEWRNETVTVASVDYQLERCNDEDR